MTEGFGTMGFEISGLGFRFQDLGSGFRVEVLGFRVLEPWDSKLVLAFSFVSPPVVCAEPESREGPL